MWHLHKCWPSVQHRYCHPAAEVRHTFVCQTAPHFGFFMVNWATGLAMPWIKYRGVTVTDDAIYVLDSRRLSGGARPTSVISVLPRVLDSGRCRDGGVRSPFLGGVTG